MYLWQLVGTGNALVALMNVTEVGIFKGKWNTNVILTGCPLLVVELIMHV